MVDVTWDIIKAGMAVAVGTYTMMVSFLAFVGISAVIISAIIAGVLKLAEVVIDAKKHITNRKSAKQRRA